METHVLMETYDRIESEIENIDIDTDQKRKIIDLLRDRMKLFAHNYASHYLDNDFNLLDGWQHESGREWGSGDNYIKYSRFTDYLEKTCYNFNNGSFANIHWYKRYDFIILEWEDFMEKKFTKDDLKVGMLVVVRCGYRYLVAKNDNEGMFFTNEDGWTKHTTKHNDMKSAICEDFDIMEVYVS